MTKVKTNLPAIIEPSQLTEVSQVNQQWLVTFCQKHDLTHAQATTVVALHTESKAGLPYIDRLIRQGHSLEQITAAYRLRDELGTLGDPNSNGIPSLSSELPIKASCQLLTLLGIDEDCGDDELDALASFLSDMSSRCPQIKSWAGIIVEVSETLLCRADLKEIKDQSAYEKIEYLSTVFAI